MRKENDKKLDCDFLGLNNAPNLHEAKAYCEYLIALFSKCGYLPLPKVLLDFYYLGFFDLSSIPEK